MTEPDICGAKGPSGLVCMDPPGHDGGHLGLGEGHDEIWWDRAESDVASEETDPLLSVGCFPR